MELNMFIDQTSLMDATVLKDPYEVFRIGDTIWIEAVLTATVDNIEILNEAKPKIRALNDEGEYEIVARILGGYGREIPDPNKTYKKPGNVLGKTIHLEEIHLAVDFGVLSRAVITVPVYYWVSRSSEYSYSLTPVEELLTRKITFRRGDYIKIRGLLSPVFVDHWQLALTVESFKGIIRDFKVFEEDYSGLLRVEVTDERKWEPFGGLVVFDRFGYDGYYSSYAPESTKTAIPLP